MIQISGILGNLSALQLACQSKVLANAGYGTHLPSSVRSALVVRWQETRTSIQQRCTGSCTTAKSGGSHLQTAIVCGFACVPPDETKQCLRCGSPHPARRLQLHEGIFDAGWLCSHGCSLSCSHNELGIECRYHQ